MDLRPYRTADGSLTLRNEQLDVFYHSVHGAVSESTHVFIRAGLAEVLRRLATEKEERPIDLLEVGLGTGLNLLLTWIQCLEGKCAVNYTSLEPFPLEYVQLADLAYAEELGWPGLRTPFLEMMACRTTVSTNEGLRFTHRTTPVHDLEENERYDLVYFDAFAP